MAGVIHQDHQVHDPLRHDLVVGPLECFGRIAGLHDDDVFMVPVHESSDILNTFRNQALSPDLLPWRMPEKALHREPCLDPDTLLDEERIVVVDKSDVAVLPVAAEILLAGRVPETRCPKVYKERGKERIPYPYV